MEKGEYRTVKIHIQIILKIQQNEYVMNQSVSYEVPQREGRKNANDGMALFINENSLP